MSLPVDKIQTLLLKCYFHFKPNIFLSCDHVTSHQTALFYVEVPRAHQEMMACPVIPDREERRCGQFCPQVVTRTSSSVCMCECSFCSFVHSGGLGGILFLCCLLCSALLLPLLWKPLMGVVTEDTADAPAAHHLQSAAYLD